MNWSDNNFFFRDDDRNTLWILSPKCASTAIKRALGLRQSAAIDKPAAMRIQDDYFVCASARHPYDRLVSAAYSTLRVAWEPAEDYLIERIDDSHIRPLWPMIEGIGVDFLLFHETLAEDWAFMQDRHDLPDLERLNVTRDRPQWDRAFDWSRFEHFYADDFILNREWERP